MKSESSFNQNILFIIFLATIPVAIETLIYPSDQLINYLWCLFSGCIIFLLSTLSYFKKPKILQFHKHIYGYKYILLISFLLGVIILKKNISDLNDFIRFREEYRNGMILGTGLFLKPITSFVSFYTGFMILKIKKIDYLISLGILLCVLFSLLLGLRIFLYPIVLGLLLRILNLWKFKKFILFASITLFTLLASKLLIKTDSSFEDVIISQITRTNYRSLVYYNGLDNSNNLLCAIKPFNKFNGCDISDFKKFFFTNQTDPLINIKMDYVNKFTGVAIPINLYMFNNYGIASIITLPLLLFLLLFSIHKTLTLQYKSALYFSIVIISSGILIEDINFINKYLEFLPISLLIGINKLHK